MNFWWLWETWQAQFGLDFPRVVNFLARPWLSWRVGRLWALPLVYESSVPFRRTVRARRTGCSENAVGARISFLYAVLNCCISSCVPTVMRTHVGITGQMRPIKTFCWAMASITSLPGRLVLSRKQFDSEGM